MKGYVDVELAPCPEVEGEAALAVSNLTKRVWERRVKLVLDALEPVELVAFPVDIDADIKVLLSILTESTKGDLAASLLQLVPDF